MVGRQTDPAHSCLLTTLPRQCTHSSCPVPCGSVSVHCHVNFNINLMKRARYVPAFHVTSGALLSFVAVIAVPPVSFSSRLFIA